MQNKYTYIWTLLLCCWLPGFTSAQTADLRLAPFLNCEDNTIDFALQIKSGSEETFEIGTSSFLLEYNSAVLEFAAYNSIAFNETETCGSWLPHTFDSSQAGTFNLTVTAAGTPTACTTISTDWQDIGLLSFNISDENNSPDLTFISTETQLNAAASNDGSAPIELGTLSPVSGINVLQCVSEECQVQYLIEEAEPGVFQVSLMPHVSFPATSTSSAQVTVKVPTGSFTVGSLTNLTEGVAFENNSIYTSPAEAPGFDYISFGLSSAGTENISYAEGVLVPLFSFENAQACEGQTVTLINNEDDAFLPPNSEGAVIFQQLTIAAFGQPDIPVCVAPGTDSALCTAPEEAHLIGSLIGNLDCENNRFCADIQVQTNTAEVQLGTSSMLFNYAESALSFESYISLAFNENCGENAWAEHTYDGDTPGVFSLTIAALNESSDCSTVSPEATTVGTVCFTILQPGAASGLNFSPLETSFNSAVPNDGSASLSVLSLSGISDEQTLDCEGCPPEGTACDDGDPNTENDIEDGNCNCAGTPIPQSGLIVSVKVLLQGAYEPETGLMRDDLRALGLLPTTEPYSSLEPLTGQFPFTHITGGGETVEVSVFATEGSDAIVDWVFLELRSADDPAEVIETRAALLQRDGDISDLDGTSNVAFTAEHGNYHLAVRHRNHLGVMHNSPTAFSDTVNPTIDFTEAATEVFGTNAQASENDLQMLWAGDSDANGIIVFQGAGIANPDRDRIFLDVMTDEANEEANFNFGSQGYHQGDNNLNGISLLQGTNNDIDEFLFFNVFFFPENTGNLMSYFIEERLP